MKQIIILFIAILATTACQKELNSNAFQVTPYFNCHNQTRWTQPSVFDSLVGTWQWQYVKCDETGFSSFEKNKGLTIEFKKDSSLMAVKDGKITKTRFKIAQEDVVDFAVMQDSSVAQLGGRIYFCNNKVFFNESYIDGCDNYFIRLK